MPWFIASWLPLICSMRRAMPIPVQGSERLEGLQDHEAEAAVQDLPLAQASSVGSLQL